MTYRDILGRTWRTNFCFRYVEDWSGQVRFVFCSRLSRDDRLNFAE
jgi:hypothetical protein